MKSTRLFILPIVAVAFAVGGCSKTLDHKGAESFVRNNAQKLGQASVTSVSCPSNVTTKTGGSFNCQVSLSDGTSGTVTIHETDANGHIQSAASDFNVH